MLVEVVIKFNVSKNFQNNYNCSSPPSHPYGVRGGIKLNRKLKLAGTRVYGPNGHTKIGLRYYSSNRPELTSNIFLILELINKNVSSDILFVKSKKVKLGEAVIFNFIVEAQTREGNFDVGLLNELKDFFKDCGKIEIRKNTAR